ncbi:PREDICTED: protein trichome birefringence-like 25 [Nicotiana attenuata]|uniref:Protein trichome birefringence-like 25 n=1 Tax=Nicotiana attenuata TaxID=49451 RepID=A0A314KJI4_NICAT|nr:PREDICTED: protein trichome birefringence-like 25 [Nicotiana attenuata]OIT29410.1 protein trichome birefringence-like 25 [Nicotiana attenuata]
MKAWNSNNVIKKQFSLVFVKFAVCFLLFGLAYRLFLSNFQQFSRIEVNDTAFVSDNTLSPPATVSLPPVTDDLPENVVDRTLQNGKCDLFIGDWVPDPSGPVYTNATCYTIESHQNCMKNGRPDTDYLYWRWNPRDCELPRFSPKKFLNLMRNKSFAFIGDSIMRNHVQSLLCILSQEEQGDEVYHDKQFKSRRWYFPTHNFTLSVIWSPFLAKATIFEDDNGVSTDIIQLHLDKLDDVWTRQFDSFDYVVIAGGKWYLKSAIYYENEKIVGCHYCPGKNITEVGFDYAYRKAMNSTMKFITSSKNKVYTFFRTTTPDHFENGEWNTGGYCNRTGPFKEGEIDIGYVDEVMRKIELEEFESISRTESADRLTMKLFDTTFLSLLRPDGHPGVYRQYQPFAKENKNKKIQNDCLHWCLPGPIDSWNDVMMGMLFTS